MDAAQSWPWKMMRSLEKTETPSPARRATAETAMQPGRISSGRGG